MKPKREKDFHNDSCDNDIKRDAERFNRICITCSQSNVECIEFEKRSNRQFFFMPQEQSESSNAIMLLRYGTVATIEIDFPEIRGYSTPNGIAPFKPCMVNISGNAMSLPLQ